MNITEMSIHVQNTRDINSSFKYAMTSYQSRLENTKMNTCICKFEPFQCKENKRDKHI